MTEGGGFALLLPLLDRKERPTRGNPPGAVKVAAPTTHQKDPEKLPWRYAVRQLTASLPIPNGLRGRVIAFPLRILHMSAPGTSLDRSEIWCCRSGRGRPFRNPPSGPNPHILPVASRGLEARRLLSHGEGGA